LDISLLFDDPEPSEQGPTGLDPEAPGQNYFKRANAIPTLSRAEASQLIERWQRFKDQRARERVILAHLRIPPSVARKAARRYGHEPNKHMMDRRACVDAWKGYRALVEELTAEGNLALVKSVDCFDPDKGYAFATYAGRSIWNAVHRRLRSFASAVDRPWGESTPVDAPPHPLTRRSRESVSGRYHRARTFSLGLKPSTASHFRQQTVLGRSQPREWLAWSRVGHRGSI
jgi:hypothetical protein